MERDGVAFGGPDSGEERMDRKAYEGATGTLLDGKEE